MKKQKQKSIKNFPGIPCKGNVTLESPPHKVPEFPMQPLMYSLNQLMGGRYYQVDGETLFKVQDGHLLNSINGIDWKRSFDFFSLASLQRMQFHLVDIKATISRVYR